MSRQIAKETIHCFVEGYFIATILLAFSLIEWSIAGRLIAAGETNIREERSFEKLLKLAYRKKWISEHELHEIGKVCGEYRNSIAHIRTSKESSRHEIRALDKGCGLSRVIEGDAHFMLSTAIKILGKTSI